MIVAGLVAASLLVILIGFQITLALGAPLGAAAWGGQNPGVLPTRLRLASAFVGLVVYPVILAVILAAASIIDDGWLPIDPTVAYFLSRKGGSGMNVLTAPWVVAALALAMFATAARSAAAPAGDVTTPTGGSAARAAVAAYNQQHQEMRQELSADTVKDLQRFGQVLPFSSQTGA